MCSYKFPTELVDLIIDNLGAQIDYDDFHFYSQNHIFACLQITHFAYSRKALGQLQSWVEQLEESPAARSLVRKLWLVPMTDDKYADEVNANPLQLNLGETSSIPINQGISQLLTLLSESLTDLTLRHNGDGGFCSYDFWRVLGQSLSNFKVSSLQSITVECDGFVPVALVNHLPASL
ncbi:hypothetical protein BKA70DRAFT_1279641 [Coprinopsis sp. MPI-PUGE-AT-0042]|nr:hypothetical protein BKA70DRAFT_1279641 [Coprinopsis sp. MPI-PUGE-AT-0042]